MELTARDLCLAALKKSGAIGRGQTPLAEDVNDAFNDLRGLLSLWQTKRWLVPALVDLAIVSTGAESYTVGSDGDIKTEGQRPDKLSAAFARMGGSLGVSAQNTGGTDGIGGSTSEFFFDAAEFESGFDVGSGSGGGGAGGGAKGRAMDYPLEIIPSREDYSRIAMKGLGSFPYALYYEPSFPLGRVYVFPVATSGQFELHLIAKAQLAKDLALSADIDLPDEYYEAIVYGLAIRLRTTYQLPPDPAIVALAGTALSAIRTANLQVPLLDASAGFGRGRRFNIFVGG